MEIIPWVAAVLMLAIAVVRAWAASVLYRNMASVPPSRQHAAHLIVLSTLSVSVLGTTCAVAVGLAASDRLEPWRVPIFVIIVLGIIAAVPGIAVHLRRYQESWLEEWRRGARG